MNSIDGHTDISAGGDPEPVANSNKVTWPGYDRFGTVQDILDQNK